MGAVSKLLTPKSSVGKVAVGFLRGLVGGYGVKAGINLAMGLVFQKIWKKPEKLKEAVTKDPLEFALFLGTLAGSFKAVNLILRSVRGKDDGWNSFIAGLISGGAMYDLYFLLLVDLDRFWDNPSRRRELALYVFARALHACFDSMVQKKWIKPIKHGEVILFCLMCSVIMYSFVYEPDNLPSGYVRWIQRFTGNDTHVLYKFRSIHRLQEEEAKKPAPSA